MIQFFAPMEPPRTTAQQKQVSVVNGKPRFFEPEKLKDARAKLKAHIGRHAPIAPLDGPVKLLVKWCFPRGRHPEGSWKITRPDTDNLQKLLKDVMTDCGFWQDDAQVCSEIAEKCWSETPGIFIRVEELTCS